jgi:hypothetical protein
LEDTITEVWTKPPRTDHVDLSAKQSFQVNLELGMVEEAPAELEVHEDVDVTVRARLSAGHGSEHSDVAGAMLPSDGEDFLTVGFQKRVDIHSARLT